MQARPMLRRNVPANVPLVPGQPDRILRLPHAGLTTQFGQAMRHVIGGGVVQFNGPHGDGDGQGRLYLVPLDFPLDGHVLASLPRVSGREFCGLRYTVLAELQAHPFVIVRRGIERAILAKRFHLARTPTPPEEQDTWEAVGHFFSWKSQEATAGVQRGRIAAIQAAWKVHAEELRLAGVGSEEIERARIGPF